MAQEPPGRTDAEPGGDSLRELAALLHRVVAPEQERRAGSMARAVITSAIGVVLLAIGIALRQALPVVLQVPLFFGLILFFVVVSVSSPFPLLRSGHRSVSDSQVELAAALAEVDDPRATGILIGAEAATDGERQLAIQAALTRLLPRAGELAATPWTEEQAERLYTHLDAFAKLTHYAANQAGFSPYPLGGTWERPRVVSDDFPELRDEYIAFLLSVVEALAAAGGEESLRHLEMMAAGKPRSKQVERVQAAARGALDRIDARLEAEREGRTLLRPTAPPPDPLLHPAQNPDSTALESLLRPTTED